MRSRARVVVIRSRIVPYSYARGWLADIRFQGIKVPGNIGEYMYIILLELCVVGSRAMYDQFSRTVRPRDDGDAAVG